MRLFRVAIVGVLVALTGIVGRAQGPALATFHGAGPVPGNPNANSLVRDATFTGPILAVGSSGNDAVLWTWDGANAAVRTVLPNAPSYVSGTAGVTAGAIRSGGYIASQARSSAGTTAVVVRVNDLFTSDLNASPYQSFPAGRAATAISADGRILSGFVNSNASAVRFDVFDHTTTVIPLLPGTTAGNRPAFLGMSSDGTVIVGTSFNASYSGSTNGHAFRYVHGAPGVVSAIPELAGGTWSKAIALSPDGNLTLAGGDSSFFPNGEVYLHNAGSNVTTSLGSPNTAWGPGTGSLSSDGSVIVMTFTAPPNSCAPTPCTPTPPARYPYLHNSHGWFHLSTALAAAGVDLAADGWSMEGGTASGVSADRTLVFGQALHENDPAFRRFEGFVAEFPPTFLAGYNPVRVAPANTSIVGAWLVPDSNPATADPDIFFFLADGTYFHIEANVPASEPGGANGFERGTYTWDSVSKAFTIITLQDTNGDGGLSGVNGTSILRLDVSGNSLTFQVEGCVDPQCTSSGTRITGAAGSIAGGWLAGNPGASDSSAVVIFFDDGTYYFARDGVADPSGHDGVEKGTYTWNPETGAFSATATVDTNGAWGLSSPAPGGRTAQVSPDRLILTLTDANGAVAFGSVGTAPVIATQPQSQIIAPGQTATMNVAAAGMPPPGYQWYAGASGDTASPIGGATSSSFTTPPLSTTTNYWVRVSNSSGTADSATATITVAIPPAAPTGLVATPAGFTKIRLRWTASGDATTYKIKRSTSPGAETTLTTGVTGTSYSDTAVAKGQTYYYTVSAVSSGGESANSAEAGATTLSKLTPLDFDGEGKADLTYFRPSTSDWNSLQSNAAFTTNTSVQWGVTGDVPVPGDYDGDGIADPAVYRPSSGTWFVTGSSLNGSPLFTVGLGLSTDLPVPGDYDGDGKTDPAVYRPSTGVWYAVTSSTGYTTLASIGWGLPGDVPAAGDYDGDGTTDRAVYRPSSGTWFVLQSSTGLTTFVNFSLGSSTDLPVPGDYDGDGKVDPAVYRPSNGKWFRLRSSASYAAASPVQWGASADLPVPADYDGDGKIDVAVYRPSGGIWFVSLSATSFTTAFALPWGQSDDVPLPIIPAAAAHSDARRLSDVDGDGKADLTVFRPSTGVWYTLTSSSNYAANQITQWGLSTDTPVPGDYDGDGKTDRGVYRPATGEWFVRSSSAASFTVRWGLPSDTPVPGDYDGDGKTDLAVYRPVTGQWLILTSSSNYTTSRVIQWGLSTDTPVANDYDGDGKTDLAVYRPATGMWYVLQSSSDFTTSTATQWGLGTDTPVPGDYDGDGKGDLAVFRPATGEWYLRVSSTNFATSQVFQWGLPSDVVVPGDYDGDGRTDLAVYRPVTGAWYVLTSSSGYVTFFMQPWGLATDIAMLRR